MAQRPTDQEALEKAIEFYELDHDLSKQQRVELGEFYGKLWRSNIAFLYFGFIPGLSVPFLLKYRKTGNTKGVNFFWATFTGFMGMSIVPQVLSPIYYSNKLAALKQAKGESSREVKIVETLPLFLAVKWAQYYHDSAENSALIMKDPRLIMKEQQNERKPGILARGDLFGIKRGTTYGGVEPNEQAQHNTNSWDNVRKHGYYSNQPQTTNTDNGSDAFVEDDDIFAADVADKVEGGSASDNGGSSWDNIRRGSISGSGNMIGKPYYQNSVSSGRRQDDKKMEQDEFEELLERERHAND